MPFSKLFFFFYSPDTIYGEAHHKIIVLINTGLVVHKAVYPDICPGIGSVFDIGRYLEPRNWYREGKKSIGTSLVMTSKQYEYVGRF